MRVDYKIFGGFNRQDSPIFNTEDLINYYMRVDPQGKKKYAFVNTPGSNLAQTLTPNGDAVRTLYVTSFDYSKLYAISNQTVYKLDTTLTSTIIGTLNTTSGYVSITENIADQLIFVDGQDGYIYQPTAGTFNQITADGFPPSPLNVAFLDGFFVIPSGGTRSFQISALNDGTQWDALDVANVQAYGGLNMGVGVVNRRLYFFKTDSTEVWYNAGASDFPFRRDNNLIFEYGCLATRSIVSAFDYLFWLSRDDSGTPAVMLTQGQVPVPIASEAVQRLLQSLKAPTDVTAWSYKDDGHIFYKLNFTTDDITLVYDLTTSQEVGYPFWFREEMQPHKYDVAIPFSDKTRGLGDCHAYFNGKHYIGSYKDATLHHYSREYATNSGDIIKRERTTGHLAQAGYELQKIKEIQFDFEVGLGKNTGDYEDPVTHLTVSRDGGKTFGNVHTASLGKMGDYRKRVRFKRLGIARDLVTRSITYAAVTPIVLAGAAIDMEVMRS